MIHGCVIRHNFIPDWSGKHVQLADFDYTEPYEESKALAEFRSLPAEPSETTGKGGHIRAIDNL